MKKRIKITYIFGAFVILLAIIAIVLLLGSARVEREVADMQSTANEYITGQDSIHKMREISDYLTEECQAFIVSGDIKDADAYFQEICTDHRREKCLEAVEPFGKDEAIYISLAEALNSSNELAEIECYAMRLAAEGFGIDPARIHESLTEVKLSKADQALSAEKKLEKSRDMVFNDDYQDMKTTIYNKVYGSLETLLEKTRVEEIESYNKVQHDVVMQNLLLIVLLLIALALLLITVLTVIVPLRNSAAYIRNSKELPTGGAAEYAYLAEAYNKMLETTQEHHELLSYEATHDELTDLYNRKFFETIRTDLANDDPAMIIVDVDHVKSINDTDGHEIGDRVLQRVSGILAKSFRSEDFVCRIGGDEFAVLMMQMRSDLKHVVESKLEGVREALAETVDDLPAVSLSIGVAFSNDIEETEDKTETLFKKADQALYKVKAEGRNGYAFYEDVTIV